jgi:6,7-dimethyl-8-ribityllumazine synthase
MTNDIDDSSENVLHDWSAQEQASVEDAAPSWGTATVPAPTEHEEEFVEPAVVSTDDGEAESELDPEPEHASAEGALVESPDVESDEVEPSSDSEPAADLRLVSAEHAGGELEIPDGYTILEGLADGARRAVAIVVARFNGEVTSRLLANALDELENAGVRKEAVTVMVVPGAFELPLAATALAKTRRYACVVALGCVIRGETPHFDYVAGEAASGLQLAALETGVPVSFGVLTLDRVEQADARIDKGAEAVRTALEMADVFSHLRAAAST